MKKYTCLLMNSYFESSKMSYGFCKSYFGKNEPLTSWTFLSSLIFQISRSTGQRFICIEVTSYKIHSLNIYCKKSSTHRDKAWFLDPTPCTYLGIGNNNSVGGIFLFSQNEENFPSAVSCQFDCEVSTRILLGLK